MYMKTSHILYLVLAVSFLPWSCQKPDEIGFISDVIGTKEDTIYVARGIVQESQFPEIDGSTRPLDFQILQARYGDAGTSISEQLLLPMTVRTWKEPFDRTIHTTKEDVFGIINDTLLAPVIINDKSGQLLFQTSTQYIDEAEVYQLDVEVSNSKGIRTIEDYAILKIAPVIPYEVTTTVNRVRIFYITEDQSRKIMVYYRNPDNLLEYTSDLRNGTDPFVSIERISEEPTLEIRMQLSYQDKNGAYVDPREIDAWPFGGGGTINGKYQSWFWNATDTSYTDNAVVFDFPNTPWPYYSMNWPYPSPNHTLGYQEIKTPIPISDMEIDTTAMLSDPLNITNDQNRADFRDLYEAGKGYISLYNTFAIRFNQGGTWQVTVRFPYVAVK